MTPPRRLITLHEVLLFAMLAGICIAWLVAYQFNWGQAEDFLMVDWYRRVAVSGEWNLLQLMGIKNGPHPLGFQAALVVLVFHFFGPSFTAVVVLNGLLMCAAAFALFLALSPHIESPWRRVAALLVLTGLFFHPSQANHLIWAFEVGWFAIALFLVLGLWSIERIRGVGPLLATVVAALASFSSAHGAFVFLAFSFLLALHRRWPWALANLVGFVVLALWFFGGVDESPTKSLDVLANPFTALVAFLKYCVQIVGFIAGARTPQAALWAGAVGLLLVSALLGAHSRQLFRSANGARLDATQRIGAALVLYGCCATLSFALARSKFGIEWALDRLHAAPLVTPIFVGAVVLALSPALGKRWHLLMAVPVLLFVSASFFTSMPYAFTRADEGQVARAVGMRLSCSGADRALKLEFNGLGGHRFPPTLVEDNWQLLNSLCTTRIPVRAYALQVLPTEYQALIVKQPDVEEALRDLWRVYGYRFDLQRAFPLSDSSTPKRLLDFAKHNAKSGSKYETAVLQKHEAYFSALP